MDELIFIVVIIIILGLVILFVYFSLSEDIFKVLGPRIDNTITEKIKPINTEIKNIDNTIGDLGNSTNIPSYLKDNKFITGNLGNSSNINNYL